MSQPFAPSPSRLILPGRGICPPPSPLQRQREYERLEAATRVTLTGYGKRKSAAGNGLLTNLIAWWPLGEASGTRNDSHSNALHLTDNNTVTQAAAFGPFANSAQFTIANSEWLSRADNDLFTPAGDWHFAGWCYFDASATDQAICTKWGASQRSWLIYRTGTEVWFYKSHNGSSLTGISKAGFTVSTWHWIDCFHKNGVEHGIAINNGSHSVVAQVDGMFNGTRSVALGASSEGTSEFLGGRLVGCGMWAEKLTQAKRDALYAAGSGLDYASFTA